MHLNKSLLFMVQKSCTPVEVGSLSPYLHFLSMKGWIVSTAPARPFGPSKPTFFQRPGAVATTAPCRVISARLQPRVISPEAVNSSPRNEGMEKLGSLVVVVF